ncbi:NADPH-dependent FMN reductase [Isoalcanivorax beigongshangi]|uniref:NADPH-dependent FMN reductase n=1 Tax=Isoalcanivorax beigongshangi TaxID=3238810 RepID=A0ABV4AES2_9GAMM
MEIVLVSGSPSPSSRTEALLEIVAAALAPKHHSLSWLRLRELPAQPLLHADFSHPAVIGWQQQVAAAEALVVATPVYKASLAGGLKVLLDLLPERALADKVVLPIASGGSHGHMLSVDYALNPVLTALKAGLILPSVFAVDRDIVRATDSVPAHARAEVQQRLLHAAEQLDAALRQRPAPIAPHLLNQRLVQAHWSI